ncbi:DUF1829 domain-containing protein [Methanolapillus millepedarum]|uniref:DUF1828 domain-containing protein n=1 Tax=Methanolapillus millepedarum TaxID=3028296 RepID=A0AA96V1P6_9EURY|nr:hypothetical protein MsAc7_03610 [Methanosarcinaceae archaeon Ac7]
MQIDEAGRLSEKHARWILEQTTFREISGCIEITTPFLDRHNDCLRLYVQKENGGYILTDCGEIIQDLEDCGYFLDTPKRKESLNNVLNGFNVRMEGNRIYSQATDENYPLVYNNMIQALISIDDLFQTSYSMLPYAENLFYNDVSEWLSSHKIRYSPHIKLSGKTGYNHEFHFLIPKSENLPERFIQTLAQPQKEKIEKLIWQWEDSKAGRPENVLLYTILNDKTSISKSLVSALKNYDIQPLLWSCREKTVSELAG